MDQLRSNNWATICALSHTEKQNFGKNATSVAIMPIIRRQTNWQKAGQKSAGSGKLPSMSIAKRFIPCGAKHV